MKMRFNGPTALTKNATERVGGFTLIEVLMAIALVAILATIAVTQFTDFSSDTKTASTRQSLSVLREAISRQTAQMRLRCGKNAGTYPTAAEINANNIATAGVSCTTAVITTTADQLFVSGGIPDNPWSLSTCTATSRKAVVGTTSDITVGVNNSTTATGATDAGCGWLYNTASGVLIPKSCNNGGTGITCESSL